MIHIFAGFILTYWLFIASCCAVHSIPAELDRDYNNSINHSFVDRYEFSFSGAVPELVVRIHVEVYNPVNNFPVLVVIKQQHEIASLKVPVAIEDIIIYDNVSRTLCPIQIRSDKNPMLIVELSTFADRNLTYRFRAESVLNFELSLKTPVDLLLRPAQPVYFRYHFTNVSQSVAVRVSSSDNVCMVLSLQSLQCPVNDNLDEVQNTGFYQTVTNLGAISTTTQQHLDGFYVVLILKTTDYVCTGIESLVPIPNRYLKNLHTANKRTKSVKLEVLPTPNRYDYIFPVVGTIGIFALFYIGGIASVTVTEIRTGRQKSAAEIGSQETTIEYSRYSTFTNTIVHQDSTSTDVIHPPDQPIPKSSDHTEVILSVPGRSASQASLPAASNTPSSHEQNRRYFSSSEDESEDQFVGDSQPYSENSNQAALITSAVRPRRLLHHPRSVPSPGSTHVAQTTTPAQRLPSTRNEVSAPEEVDLAGTQLMSQSQLILVVSNLSRKRYRTLNRKYVLYFWYLIIISIFYGLPAVQLILIYQKTLVETGNEDLCYYNFECARPLGIFPAFNSVISNIGYVLLGVLFMVVILRRDIIHRRQMYLNPERTQSHGLPQHYGLFYAMGLALVMQGIMSACYHMCPSFSNFQFDTAYMYILAMLTMLKIYQTRHPDVNASAHSAYMVMAVVILLGVTGVVYGSEPFWIAFTIFFLLMSTILTVEIYYMGHWNIDLCLPRRLRTLIQMDGIHCLRPIYFQRMLLLLIANLVNFVLAGYGVVARPKDFPSFLLAIFMINVLVYTFYYIVMKLRHREKIGLTAILYLLAGLSSWGCAVYFFSRYNTTWQLSPAQSRAHNRPCVFFNFYDTHDVWHFMSATSLYFSFMMLVNLDDDLVDKPRNEIAVF